MIRGRWSDERSCIALQEVRREMLVGVHTVAASEARLGLETHVLNMFHTKTITK